ncbi:MAG: hypothetical protein ROZ09_15880 [Thiobacillus sp.]|jgi:hypothetical protein|uniref:hypothetical protein n=1 Tax=Thiobacillus sp. TaxID=924 RepID=UPI0028953596|nr:hypothetical protein [Thiobacillus sp.]MDT3708298.1 hypothetical protein [Thiobacillus sp.]
MGGVGSGNRYRYGTKNTVEGRTSLDVRRWAREDKLSPGNWFSWQWTWGDGSRSSINVRVESEWSIRLIYRTRTWGDEDWTDVDYSIGLERTPCNFGGERVWFRCPGRDCGRRVAKLYSVGRYYVCRHCGDLAYECQRKDASSRSMSKAQNIRKKLGGSANLTMAFPDKPKGMHWRTYWGLYNRGTTLERQSMILMAEQLGLLNDRLATIESDLRKTRF